MTELEPRIDFTKIEFPSDKLTVKEIRRVWPHATDIDIEAIYAPRNMHRVYHRVRLDETLGVALIDNEREIAERAFKVALGQSLKSERNDLSDREYLVDCLTEVYIKVGLAHGEHDAAALIQHIEKAAVTQARQFGSPHR